MRKYYYRVIWEGGDILLGDELTKKNPLEQGVHNGYVVSPYVFILAVELSIIKINNTKLKEKITCAKKERIPFRNIRWWHIHIHQEEPWIFKKMQWILETYQLGRKHVSGHKPVFELKAHRQAF